MYNTYVHVYDHRPACFKYIEWFLYKENKKIWTYTFFEKKICDEKLHDN